MDATYLYLMRNHRAMRNALCGRHHKLRIESRIDKILVFIQLGGAENMSSQQSSNQPDSELSRSRQDTDPEAIVNDSDADLTITDSAEDIPREDSSDASRGCSILDGCALLLSHE